MTPAATMGAAPPTVSSAGWNSSRTLPRRRSFMPLSSFAAASWMAMWQSWPQACIQPSCSERKSQPSGSVTGRASMSARSATVGPGWPPLMSATIQVRCVV